jgi:hypothetical protein
LTNSVDCDAALGGGKTWPRYVQKYGAARTWNNWLHIIADKDHNIVNPIATQHPLG